MKYTSFLLRPRVHILKLQAMSKESQKQKWKY